VREQEFRLLVDSVKDYAIIMLDPRGRVISWNEGARRIKGHEDREIIGRHFSCFYTEEDVHSGRPEQLLRCAGVEGRVEDEGWRLRKDGSKFWAHVVIAALRDRTGKLRGYAKVTRDLTAQKRMEEEIEKVRNREQRRVGRDLHDGLGQHLTGIAFMSRVLKERLTQLAPEEALRADQIERLVNQAITQTRDLARGLYPVELETHGLAVTLQDLAANTEKQFGVACVFKCRDVPMPPDLTKTIHLYRIAQEAVRNAVQHGKAKRITIDLQSVGGATALHIQDDGIGYPDPPPAENRGMGLSSMRSRAWEIGASFQIQRRSSGGTVVTCAVPG
jgi:PAS domain S-box-containing protein